MDAAYAIRLALPHDVAALAAIERAAATLFAPYGLGDLFSETTAAGVLHEARRDGRLWVAVGADDAPVGFALATAVGGNAHLHELDVDPAHGRRGIGAALVATVVTWARLQRFPAVTLNTMREVPWNEPFYARLGFVTLRDDDLGAELAALRRREVEHGLPGERRVSMRLALA